jgi:hypothetical protein
LAAFLAATLLRGVATDDLGFWCAGGRSWSGLPTGSYCARAVPAQRLDAKTLPATIMAPVMTR